MNLGARRRLRAVAAPYAVRGSTGRSGIRINRQDRAPRLQSTGRSIRRRAARRPPYRSSRS